MPNSIVSISNFFFLVLFSLLSIQISKADVSSDGWVLISASMYSRGSVIHAPFIVFLLT
jgi:hypothetical protein